MTEKSSSTTASTTESQLERLWALRDEVRVQMHLAAMDAKDRWKEIEPHLETLIREVEEAGQKLGADLSERVREMSHTLGRLLEVVRTPKRHVRRRPAPRRAAHKKGSAGSRRTL